MLIPSQQKKVDSGEAVVVTVIKGKTVRGTTYFIESNLLVSPEFAQHLIDEGDCKWPLGSN